jgi:hypothetical protein
MTFLLVLAGMELDSHGYVSTTRILIDRMKFWPLLRKVSLPRI